MKFNKPEVEFVNLEDLDIVLKISEVTGGGNHNPGSGTDYGDGDFGF